MNIERIKDIMGSMVDIIEKKNRDYGDSFEKSLNKYGILASVIRMGDKFNRLETLAQPSKEREVKDESIQDTLLDLANYAILTIDWIMEKNKM